MRIHCIQHVPFEGPAAVKDWALERGHVLSRTALYDNESLPAMDEFDWLIVMGGPMGVYDEDMYPWLAAEKRFIGRSIAEGHTVLGICLGAQLMAAALGGTVRANARREIGWFPVRLLPEAGRIPAFARLPREFDAFHWHGDTFGIPPGAVRAAESDACPAQAFSYNDRVIGLQFPLSPRRRAWRRSCATAPASSSRAPIPGRGRASGESGRFARLNALMRAFLEGMEEAAVT